MREPSPDGAFIKPDNTNSKNMIRHWTLPQGFKKQHDKVWDPNDYRYNNWRDYYSVNAGASESWNTWQSVYTDTASINKDHDEDTPLYNAVFGDAPTDDE